MYTYNMNSQSPVDQVPMAERIWSEPAARQRAHRTRALSHFARQKSRPASRQNRPRPLHQLLPHIVRLAASVRALSQFKQ